MKNIKLLSLSLLVFIPLFIGCGGNSTTSSTEDVPFTTVWKTTADDNNITIPINSEYSYDYTVDWGDDDIEKFVNKKAAHTYSTEGEHTVKITGEFPHISMVQGDLDSVTIEEKNNALQLQEITSWGDIKWKSFNKAFAFCINLKVTAFDSPNLSMVTNMSGMFVRATAFNQALNDWDVSNVTNMGGMFFGATAFNQALNNWDVSNVTDMDGMFSEATAFNQDLSAWDVSNVTDMDGMFNRAAAFNQDLSAWDVSNVTDMDGMFSEATAFTNQDLSAWNVSKVTDHQNFMTNSGSENTQPNWQ